MKIKEATERERGECGIDTEEESREERDSVKREMFREKEMVMQL